MCEWNSRNLPTKTNHSIRVTTGELAGPLFCRCGKFSRANYPIWKLERMKHPKPPSALIILMYLSSVHSPPKWQQYVVCELGERKEQMITERRIPSNSRPVAQLVWGVFFATNNHIIIEYILKSIYVVYHCIWICLKS